jgi:hypothetical protein
MAEHENTTVNATNAVFNTLKEMMGDQLPKFGIQSLSLHLTLDAPPLVECTYYIDPNSSIETTAKYKVFLEQY